MNTKSLKPSFLLIAVIVVCFAIIRVLFPNMDAATGGFTFLGAIALFGGAMFSNRWLAYLLPVVIIFLSDLAINKLGYKGDFFYSGWQYTYLAFLVMAIAGRFILQKVTVTNIILATVGTTLIHWVLTSIVFWQMGGINVATNVPLTNTFSDCIIAHTQAIPFELKTLYGTLIYSFVMFGIYEIIKIKKPTLAYAK